MYEKKKGQPYYTNRHSCFLLQYHMVLVTKYRHPVLTGGVKEIVYGTIRDIFREKGLVIMEMNGEYYWKPYFWSDSYFVTTVSENSLAVVQDYIRNQ